MSQIFRLSNIGSKNIINGFLKPFLSSKSTILRDKMALARHFASIVSNCFIGGLVFKYACPAIDYQLLVRPKLRFSVFIGQPYIFTQNRKPFPFLDLFAEVGGISDGFLRAYIVQNFFNFVLTNDFHKSNTI